MAHQITLSRAWCVEHFANCYWSHDESTGRTQHEGELHDIAPKLSARGYTLRSLGFGDYRATLYKDHLRQPDPEDTQLQMDMAYIAARENVLVDQDW